MVDIKELKSRYKLLVAGRKTIASHDLAFDIPISSGSPVVDSFLMEKISTTFFMSDYEHLARTFQLIRKMTIKEQEIIMENLKGCFNDHKIILAAKFFSEKNDEMMHLVLDSMPFSWRLIFPLVFVKPSALFFDGWKKNVDFRLFNEFSFDRLRTLYAEILEEAGDASILKFREKIHMTSALLGYKFESEKEKAIENWCYRNGKKARELPLVDLYVKARDELNSNGEKSFVNVLQSSELKLPLTSIMGLLSSKDIILTSKESASDKLRDYVVECSSPIESLLRLREWSSWLQSHHFDLISEKIKKANFDASIPFSKITQAYLAVPAKVRGGITDSIYIPVLKKFGEQIAFLLPKKFSFFQPTNFIQVDNFLLFNVFNASSKGRMFLAGTEKDFNFTFSVDEVKDVINMERNDAQQFLLREFGGLADSYYYQYDHKRLLDSLGKIGQEELLILNIPFLQNLDVVDKLLGYKKVINLFTYFGAPTEISIAYSYNEFIRVNKYYSSSYLRQGPAVYKAINYLERLYWVEKAAGGIDFDGM